MSFDMGSARRAKDKLKATLGEASWVAGIGVEREDGVGYLVRVNVRAGAMEEARAAAPEKVDGVIIKLVERDA